MFSQIAIGTGMIVATALFAGLGFLTVEALMLRHVHWIGRPPFVAKRMLFLGVTVFWFMCAVFVAVFLWATLYRWIGLFPNWEEAIYFSIVAYTTLGFGDVLLPIEWRLLSGLEALNGLLMIGLQAAMLVEVMSRIRRHQLRDSEHLI